MTVAELIEKLRKLPQDAPVVYRSESEQADGAMIDVIAATAEGMVYIGNVRPGTSFGSRYLPSAVVLSGEYVQHCDPRGVAKKDGSDIVTS